MSLFRLAGSFLRQHLPLPSASTLPDGPVVPHVTPVPESALLAESTLVSDHPLQNAASEVGKQALGLGKDVAKEGLVDAAQEQAEPDETPMSWRWDRDPFEPGVQLTHDPLTADVSGDLAATDLTLPDLLDVPGDGLDAAFG